MYEATSDLIHETAKYPVMELSPEERHQQVADANIKFEDHGVGRGSKLEPHRVAIVEMRKCRWPYRRIAEWLHTERNVSATAATVRSFCRVRGIRKGTSVTQRTNTTSRSNTAPPDRPNSGGGKIFDFDESKPMETWKSRSGSRSE
ncbi:MAG: hypothetical protein ACI9R3_005624 [Verrucomicrobiales bacterium]|jgi:hypothetical protein